MDNNQDFQEWIEIIMKSLSNPSKFLKLKPELCKQIISIQKTNDLTEEFQNNTNNFIDNYSPKIINEILNSTPSDQDYAQNLNQILELYINLIPIFLLSDHFKFSKAAQKILIEKDYPFYFSTITNSFSFISTSPFYTSNLKNFLNSDILNKCKTYFDNINSNNEDNSTSFSFNIYYNVIYLINSFHNQWDKKTFKLFFNSFSSSFIQSINNIGQQDFRNVSENQINSIFSILFDMTEQDQAIIQNLKDTQIDFCIRMLNSEYLNKQFCAIHTFQSMDNIPDRVFQKIQKYQILDKIFKNLHDELFTGYVWLLKNMIIKGYINSSYLLNLWDVTVSKYTSYIEKWSNIFSDLTPEIEDLFWQKIAKTRFFPPQVYSLLRKIANKANEAQKNMIFQCLFQQVFSPDVTKEIENEVIQTIIYYLPRDPTFRASVQDQCIELIKNELHICFSMSLLKKLVFYYDAQESRNLFHILLQVSPDITQYTKEYLDFFVSDMRHFVTPLTDDESDEFSTLLRKLIPAKSKDLQKFFEDIACTQKVIFPECFFQNAIIRLSNSTTENELNFLKDESCIDLLISLFKEVNRKSFESTKMFNDLWIQTVNNLTCEGEIWQILYKSSSLKLASFLSKLYTNCKDPNSLKVFINHCLNQPANLGALTALLESIEQREGIIVRKDKINKWKKADEMMTLFYSNSNSLPKTVEVKVTGDFSGTFLLPLVIKSQELKARISSLLLLKKDSFNLHLNGEPLLPDVVNFSKASKLKIIVNEKDRIASVKPTDFIGPEENQFLVSLLSSNDEQISSVALKIVNNLPTNESEMSLLKNPDKIEWSSLFDTTHRNLLLYRLNAIGNLLETEWLTRFHEEGGSFCMYETLVSENHLYRSNPLILLLLEYLIESNTPIFSTFESKDFEKLINLIFIEDESNAVILFNILRSESVTQSDVLFSLPLFDKLASKSIFHHNKNYRTTICSIISFKTNIKDYLLNFLESSDCEYCSEFYQLFESSLEGQLLDDPELFKRLCNLIISHFNETDNLQKLLFIKPPNEPFVNGILNIIYKLISTSNLNAPNEQENQKFLIFMLKCIAFNPIFYYPLKKHFYSLLKILMNSSDSINQLLFQKLSEIHESTEIPSLIPNIQFTASHDDRKGLKNLGSTCYANSVLQQLFNVIDFRNSFLHFKCEENDWTFELQMIFAKLLFFPSSFINTKPFFNIWKGWDGKPLKTYEQQDAVEFLQLVIDRINEKIPHVADIFKGKIQHETVGVDSEYRKTSDEDFTTLGLEVCDQKDINDSLSTFLLPDFHNDYNADEIGRINVQRFHRILKAPKILIIQLKRFTYDLQQQQRIKITKRFTFPHDLDITKAMVDKSKSTEYELIGVVVHIGNANAGHYFSYCKDLSNDDDDDVSSKYGNWFCCNDTRVRKFDGSYLPDIASGEGAAGNTREDTAYILFYKKKNEDEFESGKNQNVNQIHESEKQTQNGEDQANENDQQIKDDENQKLENNNEIKGSNNKALDNDEHVKDDESQKLKDNEQIKDDNKALDNDEQSKDDKSRNLETQTNENGEQESGNCCIAKNIIVAVVNEIEESLRTSVLTNSTYARFIYEICDEKDTTKGPFIFNYIVKYLRILQNEQLVNDFVSKCVKYIETSTEFANFFVTQNDSHILMLLQNDYKLTREKYSQMLCHSMEFCESQGTQNLVTFLISKLSFSVEFWSNFDDFFLPFLKCVSLNNCSNSNLLPAFFEFLQTQVPEYVKEHQSENVYQRIKLTNVFKLLVVLLSSSALKNEYKSIIFSNSFLNKWIQSQYHAVAFAQLLRSFVIECPELSTVYFKFLVENANELSPESAAGHFSVLSNSQNKSSDDQINWCFNFLRTKPPLYIKDFLEHLMMKMKESKIDFSYPFLKYGNIWINEWLFSSDLDLRKSIRKFIATLFKDQSTNNESAENDGISHGQHLHELLNLLMSKLPELAQITTKRRKENYYVSDQLSVEYLLPTNTFYSLLSWVVVKGKLENELTEFAIQLVDALLSHKSLQLRDNFPQQRLVEVINLCKADRFFQLVSVKKYLSAFSNVDCTIEANKTMIFNSIKFIPNDHFFDVAKSEAFYKLASNELSEIIGHDYHHHYYRTNSIDEIDLKSSNAIDSTSSSMGLSVFSSVIFPISMPPSLSASLTNFENDNFMEYVFSQINPSTAQDIATALWRRNFHEALIDNLFALISKQILKSSPESVQIFIKQRCHFSIIEQVKSQLKIFVSGDNKEQVDETDSNSNSSSYYLTIYFQLLQAFTDSYKIAFYGKKNWYGSDKFYPLIRFWNKFKLMLADIIKLITKSNNLSEINAASSLLRSISLIDENLAIFIFEQIILLNGKMLSSMNEEFRNSAFLLIDVITDSLINNPQKRPRALKLLISEFNSLIGLKIYDKMILNSLYRRINLIIEHDNKLKKTETFIENCKIWEDIKNKIV